MPYGDDPANDPADELRLLIGDTTSPELLSDNEVAFFLAQSDDVALAAAVLAARALAFRFARLVDATEGDVSRSYSQQYEHFAEMAERLATDVDTATAAEAVPIAWAGGISYSERDVNTGAGDLIPAHFTEDMASLPGFDLRRLGWS